MSAREIQARIERERAECMDFKGFQVRDPTKEALVAYRREREAKRGAEPMPDGLFSPIQKDLFA